MLTVREHVETRLEEMDAQRFDPTKRSPTSLSSKSMNLQTGSDAGSDSETASTPEYPEGPFTVVTESDTTGECIVTYRPDLQDEDLPSSPIVFKKFSDEPISPVEGNKLRLFGRGKESKESTSCGEAKAVKGSE